MRKQLVIIGEVSLDSFSDRDAELSETLHFHSLRHSCASWLVDAGVSLYVVQNILGHSNISTTQIYSHLSQNTLHESVNRVALCG